MTQLEILIRILTKSFFTCYLKKERKKRKVLRQHDYENHNGKCHLKTILLLKF